MINKPLVAMVCLLIGIPLYFLVDQIIRPTLQPQAQLTQYVKNHMQLTQAWVEDHIRKHKGEIPQYIDSDAVWQFHQDNPQLKLDVRTHPFNQKRLANPFTNSNRWAERMYADNEAKAMEIAQKADAGQVTYCLYYNGNRTTNYFILAKGNDGKLLRGDDGNVMVLTGERKSIN